MATPTKTIEWRPPADLLDRFDWTVRALRDRQVRNGRIDRAVVLNAAVLGFYSLPLLDQQHILDAYQSMAAYRMLDEAAEATTAPE